MWLSLFKSLSRGCKCAFPLTYVLSYTCHWTAEITQTHSLINLSKQTQAPCLKFQNIWIWSYHFMTHLIQRTPIQSINRVILIDKIKTLQYIPRSYVRAPRFSIYRSFVITLSIPLLRKFVLGSDKSGWNQVISWWVIQLSVFCYCVDCSELAFVFLERHYPSTIWFALCFQICLFFTKIWCSLFALPEIAMYFY